mmetsp:Transcript_30126/g.70877  ORF Transcript_30126/g.70877 Transcript_30126/m.70877 type:complete len:297 (-) Transcript_30126:14-904(-)
MERCRETEVTDDWEAVVADENVIELQVSMAQAISVHRLDSGRDLQEEVACFLFTDLCGVEFVHEVAILVEWNNEEHSQQVALHHLGVVEQWHEVAVAWELDHGVDLLAHTSALSLELDPRGGPGSFPRACRIVESPDMDKLLQSACGQTGLAIHGGDHAPSHGAIVADVGLVQASDVVLVLVVRRGRCLDGRALETQKFRAVRCVDAQSFVLAGHEFLDNNLLRLLESAIRVRGNATEAQNPKEAGTATGQKVALGEMKVASLLTSAVNNSLWVGCVGNHGSGLWGFELGRRHGYA